MSSSSCVDTENTLQLEPPNARTPVSVVARMYSHDLNSSSASLRRTHGPGNPFFAFSSSAINPKRLSRCLSSQFPSARLKVFILSGFGAPSLSSMFLTTVHAKRTSAQESGGPLPTGIPFTAMPAARRRRLRLCSNTCQLGPGRSGQGGKQEKGSELDSGKAGGALLAVTGGGLG